ncbi:MAG: hypothetical protein ACKO6N_16405 [Myxococcota bacterium]
MIRARKRRSSAKTHEQIADRVRSRLQSQGLTEADLARHLVMPEAQVQRLLGGSRHWSLRMLILTADLVKAPLHELEPECSATLRQTLDGLELRGDVPQLRVLHTFLQEFPRITDPEDLRALVQVLRSFAERPFLARSAA